MVSFKNKSIIIIALTTLILVITLYFTLKNIYTHELTIKEDKEIIEDTERVFANLNNRLFARLHGLIKNYGEWDPTYTFVENYNPKYIKENLNRRFFENNHITFVAMYSTEGKLIFWKSADQKEEKKIINELSNYVQMNGPKLNGGVVGLKSLVNNPYIIASSAILKGEGTSLSRGIIVMGREITDDVLVEIATMENVQVEIESYRFQSKAQEKYEVYKNSENILVKTTLHDIDGLPQFTMIVSGNRNIIINNKHSFWKLLLIFLFLCSLYAFLVFYLFKKFILSKISYLSNEVKEISKTKKIRRIVYSGSDEVALLSNEINHMLKTIEKKEVEKKLNDELYRSILQSMSDGLVVYDSTSRCVLANNNATRITELEEKELLHKLTIREYPWQLINEKGEQLRNLPVTKALSLGKSSLNQIIGLKFSEEKIKWLALNTVPFSKYNSSNLDGAVLTFRDVTELQQSRSKLSSTNVLINSLIKNLNSGILYVNNNGIVQLLNERLTQLLGSEFSSEKMVGTNDYPHRLKLSTMLKNENEFNERIDKIIAESIPITGEVLNMKDGRVLLLDHVPIIVEGYYQGDLWQFTDVTDKINVETSLLLAKEEAERANMVKTEFISKVSHELRTPLNGIIGFAQIMLIDNLHPLDENQKENVHEILHAGRMLTNLINDMLDVSQIDVGKLRINMEKLEVSKVINESVKMMSPLAIDKEISIEASLENANDIFITADTVRISQVFNNLISNGIKYNKAKGKLFINIEFKNNKIYIHFKDNGKGIPEDNLQSIFDPFIRLEQGKEGMGIGLYLVKQLTEQMNGKVRVESVIDKGSTFTLIFPFEKGGIKRERNFWIDTESEPVKLPQCKILYIEDNEANIRIIENYFKEFPSVKIQVERFGADGVLSAKIIKPDVILLDLCLPDMSGYEVLEKLKSSHVTRNIPVIIITAQKITKELKGNLRKLGCVEILSKPIQFNQLLNLIDDSVK
jgi:PAS domain S-box-containing protein